MFYDLEDPNGFVSDVVKILSRDGVWVVQQNYLATMLEQNGFDNIAGVLSVSPALLERYMSAARTISRLAVGDTNIVPVFETYKSPKTLVQDDRTDENLAATSPRTARADLRFPTSLSIPTISPLASGASLHTRRM